MDQSKWYLSCLFLFLLFGYQSLNLYKSDFNLTFVARMTLKTLTCYNFLPKNVLCPKPVCMRCYVSTRYQNDDFFLTQWDFLENSTPENIRVMFLLAFSSLLDFGDFLGWEKLGLLAEMFPYNAAQWESTWNWTQPMRSLDSHQTTNEAPTRILTTTGDWCNFSSQFMVPYGSMVLLILVPNLWFLLFTPFFWWQIYSSSQFDSMLLLQFDSTLRLH